LFSNIELKDHLITIVGLRDPTETLSIGGSATASEKARKCFFRKLTQEEWKISEEITDLLKIANEVSNIIFLIHFSRLWYFYRQETGLRYHS